jgi:glycosyltransferase involved in cell wall biosynthesis
VGEPPAVRVLHAHSGNLMGGVERMLQTLAPATAGRSPVESVFALAFGGPVEEMLVAAGAEVHRLAPATTRRPDRVWLARRRLRRLLEGSRFDAMAVHSSWSQALFGPAAIAAAVPLVRWMHAPGPGPWWSERWAARAPASLIVCNSDYTRRQSEPLIGAARAVVQYPPATWPAVGSPRESTRRRLGAAPDAVVVLMAARLESWKGHELLLDALAGVDDPRWTAWIAGGPQRPAEAAYLGRLQREAQRLEISNRVVFLGERRDVGDLLAAADIYCQPNVGAEPFGLSFVEALAAGLPVVSTRLGALPEIVDSSCGVLVPPQASALASALSALVEDESLRARLGAAARTRAARFCDLPQSLARLAEALSRPSLVPASTR